MISIEFPTTAGQLGSFFGAEVIGDPDAPIESFSSLEKASAGCLTFFSNPKYAAHLSAVKDAVVFTSSELTKGSLPVTFLVVNNPQESFARVVRSQQAVYGWNGIDPSASVSPSAVIDATASIGAHTIVGDGVRVGPRTRIHPFCYLGKAVEIGEDCELHVRVTLLEKVRIGNRVKIFPHSVLGSDGFGFHKAKGESTYLEMPQIGGVLVEDDVRIGASCTVDRGTLSDTRISKGCKLDNMVHVGHNAFVGKDGILCAQVGLGGSCVIEENVVLAGQVGVGHDVRIGSGAILGGGVGATMNVRGNDTYFLTPPTPISEVKKIWRRFRKLPELFDRVKKLEEQHKDHG